MQQGNAPPVGSVRHPLVAPEDTRCWRSDCEAVSAEEEVLRAQTVLAVCSALRLEKSRGAIPLRDCARRTSSSTLPASPPTSDRGRTSFAWKEVATTVAQARSAAKRRGALGPCFSETPCPSPPRWRVRGREVWRKRSSARSSERDHSAQEPRGARGETPRRLSEHGGALPPNLPPANFGPANFGGSTGGS